MESSQKTARTVLDTGPADSLPEETICFKCFHRPGVKPVLKNGPQDFDEKGALPLVNK